MASIFGIAKRGFGKALKSYKQKKIASGKSTREERIKYGERGPTIKSVKPSVKVPGASKEAIESSRQTGHTRTWAKREKIAKDLDDKIKGAKSAIKQRAHLGQTKVLKRNKGPYHKMKYSADASTGKNTEPYSPPVKKDRRSYFKDVKDFASGGHVNTSRENRLEELGRVDNERARTGRGRRNLKDEKRRIRRELKR